ncbi:Protein Notchless [Gryllus bimaculatus]|nr:Protein Notchless [Gryllus bimaculatus]
MSSKKSKLREIYEVESKHGHFFTGGIVQWTKDGTTLLCQCDGIINVLDISKGVVTSSIGKPDQEEVEDTIYSFALNGKVEKSWKSVHKGHVVSLAFNKMDNMVVSGGTDAGVRLWDIIRHTCVCSLRGAQGVINIVKFHPNEEVPLVFASGDDSVIRGWDVSTGKLEVVLSGHYSRVTAIVFHSNNKHIVSPFENGKFVATAGEKGIIRVWDMTEGREVYAQQNSLVSNAQAGGFSITDLLYCVARNSFGVVTADQNIIFHNIETFECEKQLVGFTDEILDIVFVGEGNSHLAVATNSIDIKLYDIAEMGCQLLKGHTDLVLALATTQSNPNILLSCGKDNSVRLWMMDKENVMKIVSVGTRHTASVGSVAISNLTTSFFLSVSEDTCIKLWSLPKNLQKASSEDLVVTNTQIAHEKDINCVCVSPNDKIAATGSQDRTAKLWCTESLALLGVLRGHKRGVWCVRFNSVDRVLLSTSADCTVKIWSLDDLSCLKTLEGHEASVLRAEFITRGSQILSAGADGLLKLWVIKTSECVGTFDEHEGKIWTMAVQNDGKGLITGDSDSMLVKWKDVTKERRMEKLKQEEQLLLQEQELSNLLHSEELLSALKLALTFDRPLTVLRIIQSVMQRGGSGLADTIKELNNEQKEKLLKCAVSWNTNSKNSQPAQLVLSSLLDDLSTGRLKPTDFSAVLEGVIPYTERHFKRLTKLSQDLYFLQYTLSCMNIHSEKSTIATERTLKGETSMKST